MKYVQLSLLVTVLSLVAPVMCNRSSRVYAQMTPPKISTKLVLDTNKVRPGRVVSGSLILDIPSGYHVNAHEPLSRFALPTKIELETPGGISVGSIKYPRPIIRKFSFAERLGVYENHAVIRFSIKVPPNQTRQSLQLKALLNYQSCSDEVCFPPAKREVTLSFSIT